ncbi:MAG TPA: NAD(P)H-binding protein [Propionibacteriaceae bacterium]|nr:NAD(P)H-binding protein [Propionibacteriaceae bacterium]
MTTVAVAGATGAVGAPLVSVLRARGVRVAPISRSNGVDLRTGVGLEGAMEGADAIVDVSNVVTTRRRAAVDFFGETTARLLSAVRDVRVRHYVALSIVGVDEIDYGYYEGKRVQERLVRSAGLPATILRATQFHEFAGQMLERMRFGPLVIIPALLARPVSAREVADVLADLVVEEPVTAASSTPLEMAGPETLTLIEMVRKFQQRVGDRHLAVSVSLPGLAGRTMRHGGLIPREPTFRQGTVTFTDWLDALPALSHPHG